MPLAPGSRLDAYELIHPLGSGGMGEVWLATEVHLRRKVALKLLPTDLTRDSTRITRFEQEARAASALSHPNVCVIHALGMTAEGQRYIAMEYVEGRTLRARLVAERLTIREALDIATQIASALTAAHASGIVHRDIKPENVMLRPDGVVKVLDFGLAKLASAADSDAAQSTQTAFRTQAGSLVGTVAYMSPEMARGQPVDARTDIWSLGVLLYEIVAGRSPFPGQSSSDLLVAIVQNEPAPLARFEPDLPPELQRIVGKTLRKDPGQRYQVVKDLLLDLQALREELAASSGSLASVQAPALERKKNRRGVILSVLVLLITAVIVGTWWMRQAPQAPALAVPTPVNRPLTRLTFDQGLQTDPTFSPDGRAIAYASDHGGNFDIWIDSVSGGNARQLTKSLAQDTQPDWSPDGRSIVYRTEGRAGGLFIVPAHGGPARHLSSFGIHTQWSPDGSEIFFRRGVPGFSSKGYVVSPAGGDAPREILGEFLRGGIWSWIAPHPDGRISVLGIHPKSRFGFYTVSRDSQQVTSSKLAEDLPLQWTEGTRLMRFRWDAAGTALYVEVVLNEVQNVWRVRVNPTTLEWLTAERLTTGMGTDVTATLSRDGKRLAFTAQQSSSRLWSFPFDAAAGRIMGTSVPLTPEDASVTKSSLSSDGRRAAYSMTRAGKAGFDLWIMDIDAGMRELFAVNALPGAWSPDGTTHAYVLSRPDVPEPGEWALAVRQIGGPERIVGGWSKESVLLPTGWTPDGRSVLGSYASPLYTRYKLALWHISEDGIPSDKRILIDDPLYHLFQASFSPDGGWLSFVALPLDQGSRLVAWVRRRPELRPRNGDASHPATTGPTSRVGRRTDERCTSFRNRARRSITSGALGSIRNAVCRSATPS